jgi:hypothetical protein
MSMDDQVNAQVTHNVLVCAWQGIMLGVPVKLRYLAQTEIQDWFIYHMMQHMKQQVSECDHAN